MPRRGLSIAVTALALAVSSAFLATSFHECHRGGPRPAFFRAPNRQACLTLQDGTLLARRRLSSLQAVKNRKSNKSSATATAMHEVVNVGECVGSGSYGTVHLLQTTTTADNAMTCIGKRAWTLDELSQQLAVEDEQYVKDKAARCKYYWTVEQHCFEKIPPHAGLPVYKGVSDDADTTWMLFDCASSAATAAATTTNSADSPPPPPPVIVVPAPTLDDIMTRDRLDHKLHDEHHLFYLQQALLGTGIDNDDNDDSIASKDNNVVSDNPLATTIEVFLEQLLTVLQHVHKHDIVHRDVKPSNVLVSNQQVILIDFGSAADIATAGFLKENIGWGERVAISPIYAAPEVFCEADRSPCAFDVFSAALTVCQLLFQYLDERTDAGFHQQLAVHDHNLNDWLKTQWQGKVRAAGLFEGLQVLADRPGLWRLLQDMLMTDPTDRLSSTDALKRLQEVRQGNGADDGRYLTSILEALEECPIPTVRPLEFVASFRRKDSLGLVLAEPDSADTSDMDDASRVLWEQAVSDAIPGQVFVQGIVQGGQAEEMGIFEIGDQLQGVGELPVRQRGFERVVEMLGDQPRKAKYTTLHFDRKSALLGSNEADVLPIPSMEGPIQVTDQGAWSSQGRRKAQEDAFVVNEVHDTKDRSILLAGIMDGHLGTAASKLVKETLPERFSEELLKASGTVVDTPAAKLLESAWEQTCDEYRMACRSETECIAEYDPRQGILNANTASEEYAAGTTTCVVALEKKTSHLAVLNCGDSRGLVIDGEGKLVFKTTDHKPERELDRFTLGREQGLNYDIPECRMSRWCVPVGEYEYAVSRSLEGAFATSKGIVSDADITTLQATPGTTVAVASDGLWEVMDSKEVAKISHRLRVQEGLSAGDAAKTLCSMALEKGSTDNVSVVILYLD